MKKILFLLLFCAIGCQNSPDWSYPSIFFGFAIDGFPTDKLLHEMQRETKIHPEMIVFYLQWKKPSQEYQSIVSGLDAIWEIGAVPCLTWEPMTLSDNIEKMIPYEDILSGQYDDYISSMATEVKLWNKPLMIRFAHEMNISRYHFGTDKDNFGPQSPEIFIKMFRYIVNMFKEQQVNNVLWVFCPNVNSIPNELWNAAKNYYPGDKYVDIFGMDGYNWNINRELAASKNQSWTSSWQTFEQIFQPLYQELRSINPDKPIIVFETASVNRTGDPKKSLWIQEALTICKKWGIKGIVWFQANKEEDWRINQNDDDSYISLIQPPTLSFQTWLLENFKLISNR